MPYTFETFTAQARKVLTLAQDEAQRHGHTSIAPEHLLMGLVREGDGVAARVLQGLGVDLLVVRSAVQRSARRGDATAEGEYRVAELVVAHLPAAFEALEPPVVIEHYPGQGDGYLAEHFDLVTFAGWTPRLAYLGGVKRVRLGAPSWRRLTEDELADLVGAVGAGFL